MTSTMVQDRHVLYGQHEHTLTPSKTPSKLQRQEHPGLLLGVLDAADGIARDIADNVSLHTIVSVVQLSVEPPFQL